MVMARLTGTWRFVAVLAAALSTGAAGLRTQAAVPSVTVEEIARVWKQRESDMQSFEFEWKETHFVRKGTLSFNKVQGNPAVLGPRITYPPTDTTFEYARRLKVAGQKNRYESLGPDLCQEYGDYLPRLYVSVNDSVVQKTLFGGDLSGQERFIAVAFLGEPAKDWTPRLVELYPFWLCYRAFTCGPPPRGLSGYSASPVLAADSQGDCVVLTRRVPEGTNETLWIDLTSEHLPVRWQTDVQGQVWAQIRVSYGRDSSGRSVPSGWKLTIYGRAAPGTAVGPVDSERSAQVTAYKLNESIPASDFDVEFPVGAYVADRRTDEDYILREGGRKRIITKEEMAVGYTQERYARTESGKAGEADATLAERPWFVGGVAAAVLAALAILVFRRVRRLRRQGASRPRA